MKAQMDKTADQLEFEAAEEWKVKLKKLDEFETKSVIFNLSGIISSQSIYILQRPSVLSTIYISRMEPLSVLKV